MIKDEKKYESCVIPRNIPKSAPHSKKYRMVDLKKKNVKESISPDKSSLNQNRLKRKMTFDTRQTPILVEQTMVNSKNISNISVQSRTLYLNKKNSIQFESISPSPEKKLERQSASPNRKSLYWQSYLLEGKDTKNKSNSILKDIRDEISPITASGYIAISSDTNEVLIEKNMNEKR